MSAGAAAVLATATLTRGRAETQAFTRALIALVDLGLRPHCSDPGTSGLWLSEDAAERAEAAQLCVGCPVLVECGQAAEARGERFGTWLNPVLLSSRRSGRRPSAWSRSRLWRPGHHLWHQPTGPFLS